MQKVQVYNTTGKKMKEKSVPKEIFSYPVKAHLIHETVVGYMNNQRQASAFAKTRSEVRGGGRKPWRQKGTGRARAGSIRSPLWKGGGIIFPPKPKDYSCRMPKKAKRNALKSALSMKLAEKNIIIVDELKLEQPKTKLGIKLLEGLNLDSALIVDSNQNKNLFLSLRNIPRVKPVDYNQVNLYDVLRYRWIVLSEKAFDLLVEKLK